MASGVKSAVNVCKSVYVIHPETRVFANLECSERNFNISSTAQIFLFTAGE
jgi:hypothetical protein